MILGYNYSSHLGSIYQCCATNGNYHFKNFITELVNMLSVNMRKIAKTISNFYFVPVLLLHVS